MMHKEEGGGSPQIKVDIQRRLIAHVTMHVITPTISIVFARELTAELMTRGFGVRLNKVEMESGS
jgi:hypothetical protein